MRYLWIIAIWLPLSALWGLAGTLFGPGIVMLILALLVAALGTLVMMLRLLFDLALRPVHTGLAIAVASLLLGWSLFVGTALSWPAALIFTAFVTIQSIVLSWLASADPSGGWRAGTGGNLFMTRKKLPSIQAESSESTGSGFSNSRFDQARVG